jgi:hypothetical protein
MGFKTIDKSERCPKCKSVTSYDAGYIQICDYCGKEERWPHKERRYWGDFYEVSVFPRDGDDVKKYTFCSPDHMFLWIIKYKKPFSFMTLPDIQGKSKHEGYKDSLYLKDIRRLIKGGIKK